MKKIFKILFIFLIITFLYSCSNAKIEKYKEDGINFLKNKNYELALTNFNEAISYGNGNISNYYIDLFLYKAECLIYLNKFDEAYKIYEALYKFDNNNVVFKNLYQTAGNLLYLYSLKYNLNKNNLDEISNILNTIKDTSYANNRSVVFNQGVYYEKKGEWKDALNSFSYYLKQFPNDDLALHEIEFLNVQLSNNQ